MKTEPIVIIGGGFGGLQAALTLDRLQAGSVHAPIFLVDPASCHTYTPSFYEMVTTNRPHLTEIPFDQILADTSIHHVQERVVTIDFERLVVRTDRRVLPYKDLVIAVGSQTKQPAKSAGHDVLACKSYEDVVTIRSHVMACFKGGHGPKGCLGHHFLVMGGGPTGVEFSAGLVRFIQSQAAIHKLSSRPFKVTLVEAAPRILPMLPPRTSQLTESYLRRLGVKVVTGAARDANYVKGQEHVHTIWTIGTRPNKLLEKCKGLHFTNAGRILVDASLQAIDQPRVWAVGDVAAVMDAGVAWSAAQHGKHVAHAIVAARCNVTPRAYFPLERSVLLPLSSTYGVACFGNRVMDGLSVIWYKRWRDLVYYMSLQPLPGALGLWLKRSHGATHTTDSCPEPHGPKGYLQ